MSIATETIRNDYVGNGVLDTYPFEFIIYDQDDLDVYVDGVLQTVDVDFTVAAEYIENDDGGNIVFGILQIPADGAEVALLSGAVYMQDTVLASRDETYEETYDKAVILIKQLREMLRRTLLFERSSTQTDISLPEPFKECFLQWKDDLSGLQNVRATVLTTIFSLVDRAVIIGEDNIVTVEDGPAHYTVDWGAGGENTIEQFEGLMAGDIFTVSCLVDVRAVTVQAAGAYLIMAGGLNCTLSDRLYEITFRMGSGGIAHELSRSANA